MGLWLLSRRLSPISVRRKKQISRKLDVSEKASLFESLEGLSTREAEKELIQQDPEVVIKKESLRQITAPLQELKIVLTEEMQKDLEKLKLLLSHSMPGANLVEVIQFAVKESIQKRDLLRSSRKSIQKQNLEKPLQECKAQPAPELLQKSMAEPFTEMTANSSAGKSAKLNLQKGIRIQLPVSIKREVWRKSQDQCCFHSRDGRRCSSRFQLQIDHILPLAKNGANETG